MKQSTAIVVSSVIVAIAIIAAVFIATRQDEAQTMTPEIACIQSGGTWATGNPYQEATGYESVYPKCWRP